MCYKVTVLPRKEVHICDKVTVLLRREVHICVIT